MNYMEAALEPGERVYKRGVIHDMFGHLAPAPDTKYNGWILFTHTCHGVIEAIDYEFKTSAGEEMDASPWIFEDVTAFIGDLVLPERAIVCRLPAGRVYLWRGTYTRTHDRPKSEGSHFMIEGKGTFRGRCGRVKIAIGRC